MSMIIDLILVLIMIYFTWRGYRNGLILGVMGILALIISLAAANIVANTYSSEFTGVLRPFVSGVVDKAVSFHSSEDEEDERLTQEEGDLYTITYSVLRKVGLSDGAAEKIAVKISEKIDLETELFSRSVTDYLCEKLAFVLVFAVSFLLLVIIFAAVGNVINLAFSIPGLDTLNHLSGAAFGFTKGFIVLLFITALLRYFGALIPEDEMEKTILLKWLINSNKLADIIGI